MQKWVETLHPLEIKVILSFEVKDSITSSLLIEKLDYGTGQANQAISWLEAKGLLKELKRENFVFYELTEAGKEWLLANPALAMRNLARKESLTMPEMMEKLNIDNATAGKIFGQFSKEKILGLNSEKQIILLEDKISYWDILTSLLEKSLSQDGILSIENNTFSPDELKVLEGESKKRGSSNSLFKFVEKQVVTYSFDEPLFKEGKSYLKEKGITGEEAGLLTPAMLKDGSWKGKTFRRYSMNVPITRLTLGRKNPYAEYVESIKDKLVSLGFEEFDGPLVESEFWNNDALFMPQFHPARDVHDVYYVKEPHHISSLDLEEPFFSRVKAVHEKGEGADSLGWRYSFNEDFARRLILRTQGTVLSAKQLTNAKVPGKYFGIVRCFRYDQVDATHGADFYQTEGIVLGDKVNVRTLLGLLERFAREFAGAQEVKYVPAYFPFTEPSFEVHVKHPILGWFELGGAGIFRPEVTKPLGIDTPVMAWGLGIDRMALLHLDLSDLRELFSDDIDSVRLRRANYAKN